MARRRGMNRNRTSFFLIISTLVAFATSLSDLTSGSPLLYLLVALAGGALVGAYVVSRVDRPTAKDLATYLADRDMAEDAPGQTSRASTEPSEDDFPIEARLIWEWSLFEHKMRDTVTRTGGDYREGRPVRLLLDEFARTRMISNVDREKLHAALNLRNQIVHGVTARTSPMQLAELINVMRSYRSEEEGHSMNGEGRPGRDSSTALKVAVISACATVAAAIIAPVALLYSPDSTSPTPPPPTGRAEVDFESPPAGSLVRGDEAPFLVKGTVSGLSDTNTLWLFVTGINDPQSDLYFTSLGPAATVDGPWINERRFGPTAAGAKLFVAVQADPICNNSLLTTASADFELIERLPQGCTIIDTLPFEVVR